MSAARPRMIFLNLAVRDLAKSIDFFKALGFAFNPKFTDQNAGCMIVSDMGLVMLLSEPFFKGFTNRPLADTSTHTEALVGFSCESRAEVDDLLGKAIANGGKDTGLQQDHGFMYGRSFYDLDGHHWELVWMDPAVANG